jgi:tetratricopeptide (TPR) repeat protein
MAINNFKHALAINPRSAVLKCYLGMAYHKQNDTESALHALQEAILADDLNPLARYEYASVLISLERYTEAIIELEKLKVLPSEQVPAPCVLFLAPTAVATWLGKLCFAGHQM